MMDKETREKLADWIRDPEMELTWGDKVDWLTLPEFISHGAPLKARFEQGDGFETRKRQSNTEKFIEEVCGKIPMFGVSADESLKEYLKRMVKKHNIGELPK